MDILLYQEQSSSIFRCFLQMAATRKLSLQLEILLDHLTNFGSTMNEPWERGWRSPVHYLFSGQTKKPSWLGKLFSNQTARYDLSTPSLGLKSNRLRSVAPMLFFFPKLGYRPNEKSTFCYHAVKNTISRQKRGIQLNTVWTPRQKRFLKTYFLTHWVVCNGSSKFWSDWILKRKWMWHFTLTYIVVWTFVDVTTIPARSLFQILTNFFLKVCF